MIRDHRMGKHCTHVSLMWKGFAEFITMMKTEAVIPEELYVSARKLMQVMSKKYIMVESALKSFEKKSFKTL